MAKTALNIAKTYNNGFIANFENNKYFQLNKNATARADLYFFAIACAMMEKKEPTTLQTVGSIDSFVRIEYLKDDCPALLSSLYYEKILKDEPDKIDDICNRDEVYELAEKYANTGFGILKEWSESLEEEALFYKLIAYMDKKYEEIKDEVNKYI